MAKLDDKAQAILAKKGFAHVATLMGDGSPQVSPVWVEADGDEIVFNIAEGSLKHLNLERDPRVALSLADPDNPYEALLVQGKVTEITPDGGDDHIDKLAKKYLDADSYPFRREDEVRLIVRIAPEKVTVRT